MTPDAETLFLAAMMKAGLAPDGGVVADGQLHRFHVKDDRPSKKNGWYVLHLEGVPAGAFGSWKTGIQHSWCAKQRHKMTPAEYAAYKRRTQAARQVREAEDRAIKQAARDKAAHIWRSIPPAPDNHPYLLKKSVKNYGLKISRCALVIPLRDSCGVLHSLQFIDTDGNKRFLSGGCKRGCYFSIGQPKGKICIAEGYATAASIHEATGHAVAVAFDAGNLRLVAKALRHKFPGIKIILCADNDIQTFGNPGLTKAREAAAAVGGIVVVAE